MNYYHIYNRGAHKATIFHEKSDYERMLKLLYIANCSQPFVLRDFEQGDIFQTELKDNLVDIVAYCLMPNHIHIAIKQEEQMSHLCITQFMRKLCTGYSQYYNLKYDHSGTIWQGSFKEKSSGDEEYIKTLIAYIHLNPYGLDKPEMTKEARAENLEEAFRFSINYEYSSMKDFYSVENRPQSVIINRRGVTSVNGCQTSVGL